jgi:hypothetical protein
MPISDITLSAGDFTLDRKNGNNYFVDRLGVDRSIDVRSRHVYSFNKLLYLVRSHGVTFLAQEAHRLVVG